MRAPRCQTNANRRLTGAGPQDRSIVITRVVAKLEQGGAQLSLLRVARELAGRGHRTRLLAGNATPEGIQIASDFGIETEVMGSDMNLQWHCDPRFAAWLSPRLAGSDVVHAHMLGAWWAAAASAPDDIPLIASEHNGYSWWGEPPWEAMTEVAGRIDRFYAHGPGARSGALRAGVPESRIRTGISPVAGMTAIPRPGLPSPRIVFAGRFSPDKGPDILIEAIARMSEPPPVLMLGSGVLLDVLRDQVHRLGLENLVRFCGWVDDPGPWVAGASVQVCPSRDESFSQTAAMAMGLGVPVVGTEVDGFSDTLADGRGLLVPPDDPATLATVIAQVLTGRAGLDPDRARTWARQFETGRVAAVYEKSYQELCPDVPSKLAP